MVSIRNTLTLLFFSSIIVSEAQRISEYKTIGGFKYLEIGVNTSGKDEINLPVIIGFHYSSSTPQEAIGEYDQIKEPVRLIFPQGNFHKRSGFSYFPPDYYSKDSLTQVNLSKITLDSIAGFVRAIGKKYNRKPIVAGFSQGGDISFLLAIYYPELITAAFPLAGFVHRQRMEEGKLHAQKTVPILLYQGEDDKIVPVRYSHRAVQQLSPYFSISIKTYPGLGHDFSPQMKKDYVSRMSDFFK